jgi:hypothetical protein
MYIVEASLINDPDGVADPELTGMDDVDVASGTLLIIEAIELGNRLAPVVVVVWTVFEMGKVDVVVWLPTKLVFVVWTAVLVVENRNVVVDDWIVVVAVSGIAADALTMVT